MARSTLSDEDIDAIARRAAAIVLSSDQFDQAVRKAVRSQRRRVTNTATTEARAEERAAERRLAAIEYQQQRQQREDERAQRLLAMWDEGVPRSDIIDELGFTRPGFEAELHRLRDAGHELSYRPGID